ncbi:MAG: hypothetical protein JSV93_04050 [Candidatus Omnitrophota bacterium]|nr:MAG: hypothetical protein JSV93_04050 [Candidatus Omnitrophota bacterium]
MAGLLKLFMRLLAILWVAMGTLMIFAPEVLRKKLFAKLKQFPLKKTGIISLAVGVLLILAAFYNRYHLFIALLGLLSITKGIYCMVAAEKMAKMQDWWLGAKKKVYRMFGIIIIILGFIMLSGI